MWKALNHVEMSLCLNKSGDTACLHYMKERRARAKYSLSVAPLCSKRADRRSILQDIVVFDNSVVYNIEQIIYLFIYLDDGFLLSCVIWHVCYVENQRVKKTEEFLDVR